MKNFKFYEWLANVKDQPGMVGMVITKRNLEILRCVYSEVPQVKARYIRFYDDEGIMRMIDTKADFQKVFYDEATKIDPEVYEKLKQRNVQGTWVDGRDIYPQFGEWPATEEETDSVKKAVDQIRNNAAPDPVNPDHYGGEDDPYEAIKVIQAWDLNFCLGNVLKYIGRAGKKDTVLVDLKKAQKYLEKEIKRIEP